MEQQEIIPEYLFVTKIHENKVRAYKLISELSNNKYLYEELENGFKECFLHADIFTTRTQGGYSNPTYREYKRNIKIRKRRRKKGVAYERRFK